MRNSLKKWLLTLALPLALGQPKAHGFTHPCIPTTLEELNTIKANLNREPWKSGYAQLASYSTSQLAWQMAGPFENVSRAGNYDAYLGAWENSMSAVYNLARMWYFTGNEAYAQKAHDILLAWATTHKSFSGNEAGLALGDSAVAFGGGASILRGTWPGWTAADTAAVQNYFSNVLWKSSAGWNTQGPANKGAIYMKAGIAIALFCDNDPSKFNHIMNQMRTFHGAGLMDTLPTGQMGETGRDPGHCWGHLDGLTFVAECAWKQGVDLYSELDNRLLACGEYYARNGFTTDNPYVYFGTIDWQWISNKSWPSVTDGSGWFMLKNAYANRKGLPTPWIDRKIQQQHVDGGSFMFIKTADFTTATLAPATFPGVSPASDGLTLTTLGSQTSGRSASYSNGAWTMSGLGNGTWSDTSDDCQFAYTTMTGDCAMVAKITSNQYPSAQARAGLMIRDNLTATVGQRAWIGALSAPTMKMESHMRGWTENWGGSGYDDRSHDWPPGLPYWIKIERRDKQISTFASPDGTSWSPLNCTYYSNLPSTLYIGLFVSSGTTTTNTATFENVAFTGGTGGLVTTPAAPVGLIAAASGKAVTARWLASFGATGYDLLRTTTPGSGYAVIASNLTTTSYVDTTAVAGTNYYYVVRAKNSAGTSGNSPEFAASHSQLVPQMANLAFGGTTLASINTGSQVGGSDTAFDGNPASKWFGWNSPTGWLQYDFGAGNEQVVKRYTINSADVATRDPKDWQFQGSQDGSNWTTLDTQIGQTFAINMGMNNYNIANTTAYRYYRINVTANNGATGVAISELGLWGDSGRTIPNGTYTVVSRKSNKVLDLAASGTDAVQAGWTAVDRQRWQIAWQGNSQYRVTNLASTDALDNGGTSNPGTNLIVQSPNGSSSQLWTIVPDSDGFHRITSENSGLVVDVSGGSTADGANIIQGSYSGSDSQLWRTSILGTPLPMPPTPAGLAATPASISQINLSWTVSPGAISYTIKRASVSGGPYTIVAVSVNTPSYSDTGLLSSTTYYYVVSAVNGSGESADSAQAQATTLTAPPDAPTGLTTVLGHNQVTLAWAASGGATSYTVKRATTSGGPYTTVATGLTSLTYTDTGLTNGVTYYYVVSAANANGTGADSAETSVTPSALVVHLKFNESAGTTAADSSGRAFHATLVNTPTFSAGTLGNALNFPATASQHARLPNGITSGITDFTISTWVKLSGTTARTRIFDFGTGTNNYMELCPRNDSSYLQYEIVSGGTVQRLNTASTIPTGVWTHVALTQSGTTGTLYVNGTAVGTNAGLTLKPSTLGATTLNYIGRSQWSSDPYFNGSLDDFRLYSQALSAAEIDALAHPAAGAPIQLAAVPGDAQATLTWLPNATYTYTVKRSTTNGGPYTTVATGVTALTYTDTGLTNGVTYYYVVSGANSGGSGPDSAEVSVTPSTLRLHLRFDESSGTVAADSSGRGQNATLVNGPTFGAGKINNALTFPATSAQYATLPSGIVSGVTDFTVSTWIKVNAFATWQRVFDFGSGTNNYMNLTTQYTGTAPNNAKLRFAIRTPSIGEQSVSGTSIALPTGTWAHVAVVRSGTTVSLYINGALAGSGTIALNPADLGTTTLNYLGKSQFNDPYLNGSLDDFRIYSQTMSASQVTALATVLPAPEGLAATAGNGQVALSWNAVSGTDGYSVKRATTSGGPYTTLQANVAGTSFTDTGVTNGTTYYYVVSASNLGGESINSTEVSATPLASPAVPTGLAALAGDATVSLDWTASAGAASYNVKRATTPGGPYDTLQAGVTSTSFSDNELTNGTTYYYVVSAVNAVAESADSSEVSATPVPPAPDAPAPLTAIPSNATVALIWNEAQGADSYSVKRATASGGPFATLAGGLTSTSYSDTSAVNGTTYYYVVTASNLGGESEASPQASATPVAPPVAPAGLAATAGNATATLTWGPVAGASGYRLKRATVNGGPYALVTESTATSFEDSSLTNGTTYYYVVSAYNAGGESANSAEVSAEPLDAPVAPTGLTATATSSSKINLAWSTVSGATSYTVKRATVTGGPYTALASGLTAPSFTDSALTPATTYYYVVTATNTGGESANSTEASATTSDLRVSLAFDETSGTTANDSAGDGYHATLVNGPVFATGTLGNAVDLDGANDHATLPTGVLNGLTDFTLSVWVKPDTITNWSRVFDFGTGTTVNMFLAPKNAANGKVRFAITTGGGNGEQRIDGANALTAGAWSHVVVTKSGNTGILYVNGVEVGRNTGMTLSPSSLGATTLNYLGRSQYSDPYFDGKIDDFRIYARALAPTEIATATASQMPLATVSGLQATPVSSAQINLSWTANPNAASYNVKRATTPGGPYTTLVTGVTTNSYSSGGLNAGSVYYYVVSATNAGGEGANSAEASATTFPAAPANLTATPVSSSQLNLAWSASTGATGYTVKRSATIGGTYATVASGVTGPSYQDTGLAAGATWYYVVSASNPSESVDSTEASATTLPETPAGLAVTVVSPSALDLTWSATAGATGYDVKRGASAGGPFTTIASGVTATTFSDSGLNAATTYHYVVAATNAGGASANSASVNATTLPLPPAAPTGLAATPGNGQIGLSWASVSGATGYTVKRATVSGGSYTVIANLTNTGYTDTGLTNGTTYFYVVNATNPGGTSADSAEVSSAPIGLPSPWVGADLGTTGLTGSASFSGGAYTVQGAGSFGGSSDGFRYVYQPLSADGSIIARISTLQDTGSSARVGIMIRDTLATNSRMATLSVTGAGAFKWMRRTSTGGNVSNTNSSSGTAPNLWIRLVRAGNTITASKSTNGTSWTTIGSSTVTMASSCYIGLAVASGSTTTLNTSVFENVTVVP